MLKKYLSAFIALILIVCTVAGISVVTAYATVGMTAPDIYSTTVNVTGPNIIVTEPTASNTSVNPTIRDVSRYELENLANNPSGGPYLEGGTIYSNPEVYDEAVEYAQEVLANPNATQEEINYAYYNLVYINDKLIDIGWKAGPFLFGDNDYDNLVTIKDATRIQEIVARIIRDLSDKGIVCCYSDVNYDFKINIKDVTLVQCYIAGYTDEASCGYTGQYRSPLYYYNNQYELG